MQQTVSAADVSYEDIVSQTEHPTLVLAGPGSGKSYLLGDRVKRLIEAGADHESMMVLTFGKDAAQNMRNRLLDPKHGFGLKHQQLPRVSTLHSLGLEIVSRNPKAVGLHKTGLAVQSDEKTSELVFRDAALGAGLDTSLASDAQKCKMNGDCRPGVDDDKCTVCRAYWAIMAKCNMVDFDDQVLFACEMLEKDAALLAEYGAKCRHLLVDEYQDINAAQFRLIRLLVEDNPGGFLAVGDDAQSIYGFRGATPHFILNFASDFPGAWTPTLAYSRRCHEGILEPAQAALKRLYPAWSGPHKLDYQVAPGANPKVWRVMSEKAEAMWVARIARGAVAEHKTVLVLVPKKAFFPRLSQELHRYGVPHDCQESLLPSGVRHGLEPVWQLLEWVRNPSDNFATRLALECVINNGVAKVPGAGKGPKLTKETLDRRIAVETEVASLWNDVRPRRKLMEVVEGLTAPSKELDAARKALLELRDSYSTCSGADRGEFAKHLALASGSWIEPERLAIDLLALHNEIDGSHIPGFSSVQLMTLRKAKGLEADVAVLVGLEEDIIPGSGNDPEEQGRLFYVGMTRAKQSLHLIHSKRRPRSISYGDDITDKQRSTLLDALGIESKWPPRDLDTA